MKRINQCLNDKLIHICQKSFQIEALQNKIVPLLPEELQPHCHVSSLNNGCLKLTTNDAIWASQLRFLTPQLRDQLRKEGLHQLTSIKISVEQPVNSEPQAKQNKGNGISEKARQVILQESEHCSFEPLRKALEHLAEK